ncbi:MAG: hypothetical protein FWC77_02805 [Defluviitaleaceae bacterium]|nr:hypothetical protein [Defluviitaleaceae bacterium]
MNKVRFKFIAPVMIFSILILAACGSQDEHHPETYDCVLAQERSNNPNGYLCQYDADDSGIPDIVIRFIERGTRVWDYGRYGQGWGYANHRPFVLFRFIDGAYTEVGIMPFQPAGHYYATFPYFYVNYLGEKIIYIYSDGHTESYAYHFRLTGDSAELEPILFDCIYGSDVWIWWHENNYNYAQIYPLTGLQNEITLLISAVAGSPHAMCSVTEVPDSAINLRAMLMQGGIVAIWADAPLRDFRLIEVLIGDVEQDEEEKIYLYPGETLSSVDELPPNMPFILREAIGGATIPTRGIEFLDENGVRRYFLLSFSGVDGSVGLGVYPLDERVLF